MCPKPWIYWPFLVAVAIAFMPTLGAGPTADGKPTATEFPPAATHDVARILRTEPDNRSYYAPSKVDRIIVVFDRPMRRDTYSFQPDPSGPTHFPKRVGEPEVSEDGRTWSFPVDLKRDTAYRLWFNNPSQQGFVALDGSPGEWYKLGFRTGR